MKKNMINSISDKLTYWNGGFYSDKNDSRIIVPKSKPGVGFTMNFGNPKAIILFSLIILLVIGSVIALSLIFGVK